MRTLTNTLLAVTVTLGGAVTGPTDDAETTASPHTSQSYRVPEGVTGSLVYNPAGVGTHSHAPNEPVLEVVSRDCLSNWDGIEPNLTWTLPNPITVDAPDGGGQVVIEAGEYPGWRCSSTYSGVPVIVHPEHGAYDASPGSPYTAWTDEQTTAMVEATGQGGVVIEGAPLTAEPGPGGEPLVVLAAGTELDAAGLPVDGQLERGSTLVSGNYLPARVDGYTGWLPVEAIRSAPAGGLASLGVETETVTVGTVADELTTDPGIAVYPIDRALDPEAPALRRGDPLTYLHPGDRITASTNMWETLGGTGWIGFAISEARIAELPETTQHLGRTGRLVELEDGRVGWSYAYLTLDVAALSEKTAPTTEPTEPTDSVPTIGAPVDDQATTTAPPTAQVDPMTVPIGEETVTRRGARIGVPSTFPIATGPSPEHSVIGKLTEGTDYPSSKPFAGTETLQGDQWRAIHVLNENGEPTRAFVRDADVLVIPGAADTDPPTLDPTWTDLVVEKGSEVTEAGVEKWGNRVRGKFNPLRSITNTVALAVALPIAALAALLLGVGAVRSARVVSGEKHRLPRTPIGMLFALAPTAAGSVLSVAATLLMPATTLGWIVAGLLSLGASVGTMARVSSRRAGALGSDLTGVTWDRIALWLAPALVLGSVGWWLLGLMPAVVITGVAVGAGISMAGARVDEDEPDPPVSEKVSIPEEPDPFAADPDELEGQVGADPYNLSDTSFETSQPVESQQRRTTD